MSDHVIQFREDGTGIALHTDAINLAELGNLEVTRASTVEWEQDWQTWCVIIAGKVVYRKPSRAACLDWERNHFNSQLLKGESLHEVA